VPHYHQSHSQLALCHSTYKAKIFDFLTLIR
jgi:hypothetical protein